jgi:hypothetical protein
MNKLICVKALCPFTVASIMIRKGSLLYIEETGTRPSNSTKTRYNVYNVDGIHIGHTYLPYYEYKDFISKLE